VASPNAKLGSCISHVLSLRFCYNIALGGTFIFDTNLLALQLKRIYISFVEMCNLND
jgi:hypothetical protein